MTRSAWRTVVAHPWAVLVAVVGLVLRIWVLRTGHGQLSADEATTGLTTLDVLDGRFRVIIPGNAYTATLEAYVFAPVVAVFGPHVVALKALPIVLWAAAAVVAIVVGRRLLEPGWAWAAGGIVWLAPGGLLIVSTRAYFGYAGGVLAVLGALWALGRVADAERAAVRPSLVAGFLAGVAFYVHPMYSAVVLPAALVVTWRHHRAVRTWWLPAVGGALAANLPWLLWNVRNSFASLDQQNEVPGTYTGRLTGFFTGLLPRDLGLMRSDGVWVVARPIGWLLWWGLPLLALAGAVVLARRSWAGRMYLAAGVLCWPIMATFAALGQVRDGRYGVIPLPVFALTLPAAAAAVVARSPRPRLVAPAAALVVGAVVLVPHQREVVGDTVDDPNAGTAAVVQQLDEAGIEFLDGSYWVTLPVSYVTDARIATAVVEGFPVRYPHLQERVDAAPATEVAFAFQYDDVNPNALRLPMEQYERVDLPGVVLFLPPGAGS